MLQKRVRPDAKGRITLGHLADGVSEFLLKETKDHEIILVPFVTIPAREKWLYNNKDAMKKVQKGLKDAASGRIKEIGSFTKYLKDNDD